MPLHFDRNDLQDFESARDLEWLETNGLGGWASSTVSGAHSRRYHGLLVAATRPPVGRVVLVSKLEETLWTESGTFELGANQYPGAVHPRGYEHLSSFSRHLFPSFEFAVDGIRLRKTVTAVHGENTTLVVYKLSEAPGPVCFGLRPFLTWRDYHSLNPGGSLNEDVVFDADVLQTQVHFEAPRVFIRLPEARFESRSEWYYNFQYEEERRRGLDFQEDLWTPGMLIRELQPGQEIAVLISTDHPGDRDALDLYEGERRRREGFLSRLPRRDDLVQTLGLAADQFIVRRDSDLRTLIAGYHWFADWGRDTMIALPGICLATGRFEDAAKILRAFARSVDRGMLPNRFPDQGEAPEYNTVDATLWFFVAIQAYLRFTGDEKLVRSEFLPALRDILKWHERGTRYGIRVDDDGLLLAGEPGVQLTWMDAKIGDWVVTPREGKAVEVNALWYNALKVLAELEKRLGDADAGRELARKAERVRRRFNLLFWNEELGCLFDVIQSDGQDSSVRPNQILALSLPFPLLSKKKAARILSVVEEKLLTPVGLRSLAPDHPDYHGTYEGDPLSRDGAYHQGTVWNWLLGPYLTALIRYRKAGRERARQILERTARHLSEAGVGTFSEIFDGDPPHRPRGAVAQAWSVGELLRVLVEEFGDTN